MIETFGKMVKALRRSIQKSIDLYGFRIDRLERIAGLSLGLDKAFDARLDNDQARIKILYSYMEKEEERIRILEARSKILAKFLMKQAKEKNERLANLERDLDEYWSHCFDMWQKVGIDVDALKRGEKGGPKIKAFIHGDPLDGRLGTVEIGNDPKFTKTPVKGEF